MPNEKRFNARKEMLKIASYIIIGEIFVMGCTLYSYEIKRTMNFNPYNAFNHYVETAKENLRKGKSKTIDGITGKFELNIGE